MRQSQSNASVPVLQARNVSKSFAGIKALADVSLTLWPGEVHVLMGENGAGKSTLMKILAGLCSADSGEIVLSGSAEKGTVPICRNGPEGASHKWGLSPFPHRHAAIGAGIVMIHQELMPIPDMTVAENILLGHEPASWLPGWLDRRAMQREAKRLLDLLEVDLPLARKMRRLSVAQIQAVEIAKALGQNARVLIMDEPTAAISDREVEALFKVIETLKQRGAAIVYITHKMDDVFRIADKITVLRDGAHIGTYPAGDLDGQSLIALMVGRPLAPVVPRSSAARGATALSIRGLSRKGAFQNVAFELGQGEILGITGLMGAGRTELVSAIFGLAAAETGEIRVAGLPVRIRSPADAMRHGIGMVTEDRKGFGLVPAMSVMHNMTLASLGECCFGPFIRRAKEAARVDAAIRTFAIKTADARQAIDQLSGGNQQKVVIARSLLAGPSVIILDEPTRGIDVAAKAEVHALVAQLAQQGKSIILVSSELPEILALSDRLLVMRQGSVAAELNSRSTSQEEILKYAMPI